MAGLLDFFTGGSDADLYGGLLNEKQRSALATRGLAAMAEKFGQLAMPQRAPIPLGAVLGQGFGAYGAGTDEAVKTAFEAQYKGAQAQQLQSQIEYAKGLAPLLGPLGDMLTKLQGGGGLGAAMPGSGSTGGAAVSPSAGGGGDPSEADIIGRESGGKPYVGYGGVDLSNAPLNEYGFPIWAGKMGPAGISHAAGLYQFQPGTWATYAGPLGIKDFSPESQRKVYLAARAAEGARPWAASAGAPSARSAAPTAGAPAPAGGGGLLNLPQVTNAARNYFGATGAPAPPTENGDPLAGFIGGSAIGPAAPLAKGIARPRAAAAPPTEEEAPGFAGRQLVAQLGAGAPLDDVSQYRQVAGPGGGEPSGMVSGLLTPGGPLTRGDVPNMPAMPAAPTPANDPGLQLGPLAPAPAAAPAAAAPAAAGPGLLAPQGAAPAAALPQVNPAYGNVLAQIARLRAQSELAGIKNDPFAAFASALKDSPAYQAQIELAKRLGVLPLIGPETTAKKAAEEPFDIRASERALGNSLTEKGWRMVNGQAQLIPGYDTVQQAINLAQAAGKGLGELPTNLIIKGVENQNAIRQAAAANGTNVTFDQDGKVTFSPAPGAKEAAAGQAGAVTGAQERAKADVAAGTAPGIAGQTKYAEGVAAQDTAARAQAVAARNSLYLLDDARQQLEGAGIFTGAAANLKTTAAQALAEAGFPSDKLVNTQTYLQQAGARAAEILRSGAYGTGSGVSSNDLRAADKLANGDNTVELGTIKRILDLTEKTARRNIDMFNDSMKTRAPETMIQHPPRFLGYTNKGGRLYQMPDGSQAVRE